MHLVNIKFDRVFDIVQDASRNDVHVTLFSFESDGKRLFSISIEGQPRIENGMEVVAALVHSDDWKSLLGWKDLHTGKIHLPKLSGYVAITIAASLLLLSCAVGFYSTGSYWFLLGAVTLAGFSFDWFNKMRKIWHARRALENV